MKIGDNAETTRSFNAKDLSDYARLSGHEISGEQVPEPLIGALFSYLLGVKLPGLGTNYLKQETRFQPGAMMDEPLTAKVKITRLRPDKQLVDLETTCRLSNGRVIASGRALVYVGDVIDGACHVNCNDKEGLVLLERRGKTAIVSLNRAKRHNALIPELLSELLNTLKHDDCQTAAAVILRAEGRSFSIGGDLHRFQQHRDEIAAYSQNLVGLLNQVILAIYTHPAVIVCAVHGQVTGGSLGLLLAADRVIMRRGATITPYFSVVGFSPDGGWTALLPDIIGRQQTMHWLTNNASHDADTCLTLGLAHQVVDENCDAAALVWVEKVADMQSGSTIRTRRLLNTDMEALGLRLATELDNFVSQIQTQQALDGIDHFLRRQANE